MSIDFYRLLPSFWIQTRKTFDPWDKALNKALDTFEVTEVGPHTARVGPFEVWISNYPYAFGYNRSDALELIPRCRTRIRLRKAIMKAHEGRYEEMMRGGINGKR